MSRKTCYECMHKDYCYAYSSVYGERAESCIAYNNPDAKYIVDRSNVKKQWEKRGD
jgi:hypothetical protein